MTFTIDAETLSWVLPVALAVTPFVYGTFRKPSGGYMGDLDLAFVGAACWIAAAGLAIGSCLG